MAKYSRPRTPSFVALFLCYVVCLRISTESNAVESQPLKSSDVNVSIRTINGKVYVNWNTSSLWQSTTVYFISSLIDNVTNTSYPVNISVCRAFTHDKNSWEIEPVKGNLLEFCNKSRKCWPVKDADSLVGVSGNPELSCQLFTTCTNFKDVFRIQVISIGERKEYSFQSEDMTILSQNIPPLYEVTYSEKMVTKNEPITFTVNYFQPSQLCGFGAKPTDTLQFVFKHYKVNDSNCFYMGEKTASYAGKTTEVRFDDIIIRDTDVMYFHFAVTSLASNKTSPSQRFQKFITFATATKTCSVIGGVVYISWRPQWNCFDKNITEQAEFCFYNKQCLRVCEASFFSNGTFRAAKTYGDDFVKACNNRNGCTIEDKWKDIKFINVSWSHQTQRISCTLFRTCMDYSSSFSIKASSLIDGNEIHNVDVCPYNRLYDDNEAAVPHSVHAVDVQAHQVTIMWKSPRCGLEFLLCEVNVNFNGEESKIDLRPIRTDGINNVYNFTKKNLLPYKKVTFQVFHDCSHYGQNSKMSPLKSVITKPAAPQSRPYVTKIQSIGGNKIELSWEYGGNQLNGVPNETRIIGTINQTVVFPQKTINGVKKTASLRVNETQRCAYYRVKICNAPHLCSIYSKPRRMVSCTEDKRTTTPPVETESSIIWVIISAVIVITVVLIASVTTFVCCQKRRKKMRPKLPVLEAKSECTGDYIPVGQLSHPGEYDTLDKEECLEELVTKQ